MNFSKTFTKQALLSAFAASVVAAGVPSAASAQQAGTPPKGWFKVCTKQEYNDVCIVQNLITANSGQLITAVGLITVADNTEILISRHVNDREGAQGLINRTGRLIGPSQDRDRPHPAFLSWHREHVFKT